MVFTPPVWTVSDVFKCPLWLGLPRCKDRFSHDKALLAATFPVKRYCLCEARLPARLLFSLLIFFSSDGYIKPHRPDTIQEKKVRTGGPDKNFHPAWPRLDTFKYLS